ncbi:7951_t:CDS:2 [Entrophospora sp. SA101]|nr:7951_t:CDS:2 [Entrophospora sp. SA101]
MLFLPTPTHNTIRSLVISYAYIFGLLVTVEVYQRKFNVPLYISRKIIHIGAGTYLFFLLYLFEQWEYVVLLNASFVLLNYISYRIRLFKSMDPQTGATLGTLYFPFSCALLFGYYHEGWENGFPRGREYIAIAGIMAMTFGDAFASIIGKRYGKRYYHVVTARSERRTIEGSLANFVTTAIAILFFWSIMSPPTLLNSTWNYITGALIGATASTLLEAISPMGTDNISVPLGVSFILSILNY